MAKALRPCERAQRLDRSRFLAGTLEKEAIIGFHHEKVAFLRPGELRVAILIRMANSRGNHITFLIEPDHSLVSHQILGCGHPRDASLNAFAFALFRIPLLYEAWHVVAAFSP
jgi:hypothetical protein